MAVVPSVLTAPVRQVVSGIRLGRESVVADIQNLTIPAPGGFEMPAALARPSEADAPRPGVIVVHEMFGLNDDIRRIAARFADAGYVAIAPDLFARAAKPICIVRAMRDLRRGQGETFADLDAAREYLLTRQDVDASRIGVAGFCIGGGFALLYAAKAPVGATAPFYGDVPSGADALEGVSPVCASYGGRDRLFAPKAETLRRHLSQLGVPHEVKVYPEAGHSFMNRHTGLLAKLSTVGPMKVGYHQASAEDAWSRMLGFFAEHLGR